jgi:alkanesulfonate monooxygenase SsuD/methylene tetrahydromethanopterin reductase-like flavin-dependent oxidoreductase (luciferase family)
VETGRVRLGTLVARVGLLPDAILVNAVTTLHRMVGDRLVAALGVGDAGNRDENLAYGVAFEPRPVRLERLAGCVRRLRAAGVTTWVGGVSDEVLALAAAEADGWNGWGADPVAFAAEAAAVAPAMPTWAGQVLIGRTEAEAEAKLERHGPRPGLVHGTAGQVGERLAALAAAGAGWAVCAPLDVGVDPEAVDLVVEAARDIA